MAGLLVCDQHISSFSILHIITSTDVLALLLTDSLIFLQEKDQRYTFATVVCAQLKPASVSVAVLLSLIIPLALYLCTGSEASGHCPAEANSTRSGK